VVTQTATRTNAWGWKRMCCRIYMFRQKKKKN